MDKLKFNSPFFILLLAVCTIATCGLIYELVAGALASYVLGDSVKQFSLVIGIYLFAMGIGSYFTRFFNKEIVSVFIQVEILIGLIGGSSAAILFYAFGVTPYFNIILYWVVFSIGFLVGFEIPLLMKILQETVTFNNLVSSVFTFDYIGALFASVLFPLVLIPQLGLMKTSIVFGIINTLVAILVWYFFKDQIRNKKLLLLKAISVLVILIVLFVFAAQITKYNEQKLYNEKIVYSTQSPYQKIVLTRNSNEFKLYLNNNLQFSSSDEYRYHEALVHPIASLAKNIENVLILGGGDGLAVRELLKYNEVKKITLVDLDKAITSFAQKNPILSKLNQSSLLDKKVTIINADAFVWLQQNKMKYDLIIIDFPDPSNYSVGKLYTQTFYAVLKNSMNKNALLCVQSTSPFFAPKSFWCINNTLKAVFGNSLPFHVYLPSFGEWGFSLVKNNFDENLALRRKVQTKFYDFDLSKLQSFSRDMQSDVKEINRLDNQILIRYFDEEWGRIQ